MTLRNGSVLIDGYPVLLTVWTSGWPGKGRSATFTYKTAADGTADSYVYDCCAPSLHVDRHGVTNRFTYDGNKRLESALAPFDAQTSTALAFSYLGEGELAALGVAAATGPDLPAAHSFATRTFAYAVTNGLTRLAARKDAIGRTRESFTHTFDGLPASRADACGNLATN
ncbi:MAG: hypothetical protein GX748_00965, partial [Lentisphaerae bacterium]|nr:hypothetical protein [Lentisphaerota bacterium]